MRLRLARAVVGALVTVACAAMAGGASAAANASTGPSGASNPEAGTPVFCYYYIWYDPTSWDRAKTDYPSLGRYSSSNPVVMRQQIAEAKAAGITAFLVSWKATPVDNARLAQLAKLAVQLHFKLGLVYEGLDYARKPLPISRVTRDLEWFARTYAADPVFDIGTGGFTKPLVIWSGTSAFSTGQVAQVTQPVHDRLMLLASAKSVTDYARVAPYFDGNAYYWSSVNPYTMPGYGQRLADMSRAVHARGRVWIAPVAPGFDARLVGGTSVVPRNSGQTLRTEYNTALGSQPDAIGLISWNEFSENTYIEPSVRYGRQYLDETAQLIQAAAPVPATGTDSSSSGSGGLTAGFALVIILTAGVAIAVVRIGRGRSGGGSGRTKARLARAGRAVRRLGRRTGKTGRVLMLVIPVAVAVVVGATTSWFGAAAASYSQAPDPAASYLGPEPTRAANRAVIVAVGDISCPVGPTTIGDTTEGATNVVKAPHSTCQQATTARLTGQMNPDAVLALGDNQYPNGAYGQYEGSYAHSWGRFFNITYPVPGNHEYLTNNARGYFEYYGTRAGSPSQGWYSYDLADWHIIALNSECFYIGGCGAGSPEERWLKADLASHPDVCTLAYWHEPRWSSGTHGSNPLYDAFWRDLSAAGADIVLSGHDHDYERFAPLSADGTVDAGGVREFIVGTGGESHYKFHLPAIGSQVRIADTFGLLRLVLAPGGYAWKFVSVAGHVLDAGEAACH